MGLPDASVYKDDQFKQLSLKDDIQKIIEDLGFRQTQINLVYDVEEYLHFRNQYRQNDIEVRKN